MFSLSAEALGLNLELLDKVLKFFASLDMKFLSVVSYV